MKEIHSICIENGLKYTLMGGTLIGAIRHNGFIPWDDDIDIGLLYDDYIKLLEIMKKNNHPWLIIEYPGCSNYEEQFIKIYDKRTTLKEKKNDRIKGVFIDVFPIIPIGNTIKESKKIFYKDNILKMTRYNKTNNSHSKWYKMFIYKFVGMFYSSKRLDKLIQEKRYKLSKHLEYYYYCDPDGTIKGIVEGSLFSEYTLHIFEDSSFMILKDYDKYLNCIFGDYMKLPPADKQIPSHIEYLDLSKSYLDS